MHQMRQERLQTQANLPSSRPLLRARAVDALRMVSDRPLVVQGRFDNSAIMKLAIAAASKDRAFGAQASWRRLLGAALKFAWARAKLAHSGPPEQRF